MSVYVDLVAEDYMLKDAKMEDLIELASDVVNKRNLYHKILGKLSMKASELGDKSLVQFSLDVFTRTGYVIAPETLRNYRWVYEKLSPWFKQIPQVWSFTVWQKISQTDNPKYWIEHGVEYNLSSKEMMEELIS